MKGLKKGGGGIQHANKLTAIFALAYTIGCIVEL